MHFDSKGSCTTTNFWPSMGHQFTPCFLASFFLTCLMRAFTSALEVWFPSARSCHTPYIPIRYEIRKSFLSGANKFALPKSDLHLQLALLSKMFSYSGTTVLHIIWSYSSQHFHCVHTIRRILTSHGTIVDKFHEPASTNAFLLCTLSEFWSHGYLLPTGQFWTNDKNKAEQHLYFVVRGLVSIMTSTFALLLQKSTSLEASCICPISHVCYFTACRMVVALPKCWYFI